MQHKLKFNAKFIFGGGKSRTNVGIRAKQREDISVKGTFQEIPGN